MVISGDLITDFAVHHLTDLHALHNASVTALYARYFPNCGLPTGGVLNLELDG